MADIFLARASDSRQAWSAMSCSSAGSRSAAAIRTSRGFSSTRRASRRSSSTPTSRRSTTSGSLPAATSSRASTVHGEDVRHLLQRLSGLKKRLPYQPRAPHRQRRARGAPPRAHAARGRRQALGVVHRDDSLSNVMVSFEGMVKLPDSRRGEGGAAERREPVGDDQGEDRVPVAGAVPGQRDRSPQRSVTRSASSCTRCSPGVACTSARPTSRR